MLGYLHLFTLFSWMPLALLASTQRDRRATARFLWLLSGTTALLCAYTLYLDFVWSKTVVAPIRVDLVFVVPLTTITFSAVGLWGLSRPGALAKLAAVLLLVLSLPTLALYGISIRSAGQDLQRLDRRPALIYEAQFRNPDTFRSFFGTLDDEREPRAGHFQATDPRSWASRVIINAEGHFWLLFKCRDGLECVYAQAELGDTPMPGTFRAQSEVAAAEDATVLAWSHERFTLKVGAHPADDFVRAPVALHQAATASGSVTYHGAFYQARVDHDHLHLVQLWLWQSDDRWVAYYVRGILECGSTNDFVFAAAYDGKLVANELVFAPAGDARGVEAFRFQTPAPGTDHLDGQVWFGGRPLETVALARGSLLRSPIYESAPLTDLATTIDWLTTVSSGYGLHWKAECPESH